MIGITCTASPTLAPAPLPIPSFHRRSRYCAQQPGRILARGQLGSTSSCEKGHYGLISLSARVSLGLAMWWIATFMAFSLLVAVATRSLTCSLNASSFQQRLLTDDLTEVKRVSRPGHADRKDAHGVAIARQEARRKACSGAGLVRGDPDSAVCVRCWQRVRGRKVAVRVSCLVDARTWCWL